MISISEWSRKIAINRWNKIISRQHSSFDNSINSSVFRAAICGFLAGDGCVKRNLRTQKGREYWYYRVDFLPDDTFMRDAYIKLVQFVYHKTPSIRFRDGVYIVRMTSRAIWEDLNKFALFGIHTWTIPNTLFSEAGTKVAWLRGFFSAEAYVGRRVIKLQTVNMKGMDSVSELLFDLGIHHTRHTYYSKNPNHSVVSIICISSKDARLKFFHEIGFWHSKKTAKLAESLGL